VLNAGNHIPVL